MRRATNDTLDKVNDALINIESAILYAVLEQQPTCILDGLRRAHRRAQATYSLLEERQLRRG